MKKMKLSNDIIYLDEEIVELKTVTTDKLKEIIVSIVDGNLKVEVEDDQTSPNAVFLKSLKNEVNNDFIEEVKAIENKIKIKEGELKKTIEANENYDKNNIEYSENDESTYWRVDAVNCVYVKLVWKGKEK